MFEVGHDILKHTFSGTAGNSTGHRRLRTIYIMFTIAFIAFSLRTIQLGVYGVGNLRGRGSQGEWIVQRADIIDRNGDILAKSIEAGHITLHPNKIKQKDKDKIAQLIHDVLPYEYSLNDALKLVNSASKFMYVKKYATDAQRQAIMNARLDGIDIERFQMRRYPKRNLFSHVVGFVGKEGHGLEGAELYYDEYLSQNRDPLQLSLDARIQAVFYEQLSLAMQKYQAKAAMGMLINSRTGEMVAMVSLPDFDPENLRAAPAQNHFFKPMRGVYEMGSIFKVFNTALAYENGLNKKKYYVAAPYKVLGKGGRVAATIHDIRSFKPDHPNFTPDEIMLHSCNVGSAQIALDLPDGAQKDFFERIHMDEPLDLEFGRTERPLVPKKWGPVEKATVSFGHGISVTPMHLLLGVNAMANGGIYIYPTLHKRDVGAVRGKRVLPSEISAELREIMVRIAEETSARQARIAGIRIGGKTATAEKRINGKIDKNKNMTAFAGIFPADAPQYTILVVLDEPHGTAESFGWRTAAWNAVPTAGKILDGTLPLLFE